MPKRLSSYQRAVRSLNKKYKQLKRKLAKEHRGRPVGSKTKHKKRKVGRPKKR